VQFQLSNTIPCTVHSTGAQTNMGLCSLISIMWFAALHNPLPYKCPPLFTCLLVKAEVQFVTANRISWHHNKKASKEHFRNTLAKHSAAFCTAKCRTTTSSQKVHRIFRYKLPPPPQPQQWCRFITVSNCKDYFELILLLSMGSNYHHIQQRSA